ncbi:uncharacterized protein DDB_G0284459-like [Uranotaenia lowii]|uniref:uncharacterized protein DDB_G0284459-like n=1 Tax=Uranotaenia lowii TaxID=190385 RepID=UPI00247AD11E|nr:uncharacterized protein DDB_G0284459-like [Uranotaenia lowii]XP_055607958.1 uncharacterized protein DDB_G0284459-like [Uranotaenia lowii]XP_055607959.1 uncharacterized protein DDB_G0284459-like [Uranotaenia lowii]XP_055607960.1 uncharacterized protein DDB_G0284459-like [Uranotaenia lowii]
MTIDRFKMPPKAFFVADGWPQKFLLLAVMFLICVLDCHESTAQYVNVAQRRMILGPSPVHMVYHSIPLPVRPRYARRGDNDYLAYNIHKTISPRDINRQLVDGQTARKAMVDVQQTIAEVQRLLAADPSLPRLTKGEIEELFENVTREELAKSLREGDHARAQHMRALMLVLPYHTNNLAQENLQSIYTLPPVTRVVPGGEATTTTELPPVTTMRPAPLFRPNPTSSVPITTIRFTTPKATTFHPALPNAIREETKPSSGLLEESTEATEDPVPFTDPVPTTTMASTSSGSSPGVNEAVNEILSSLGFVGDIPTFKPLPVETTTLTTTTTERKPSEDPGQGDPKVSEELRSLLRSFGLLGENEDSLGISPLPPLELPENLDQTQQSQLVVDEKEPDVPTMAKPDIKPDDFVAFKPLPSDTVPKLSGDLSELLKSFGLLDVTGRDKKSMKNSESSVQSVEDMDGMPMIDKDLVIPQMMPILDTLGIPMMKKERNGRKFSDSKKDSNGIDEKPKSSGNPKKKEDNEDYRKLEQLWETIRELEKLNTNLTEDKLEALDLRNFNLSESLLSQGPNPLENLEVTRINEIKKRQEPSGDAKKEDSPIRISLDINETPTNSSDTKNDQPRSVDIVDVASDADPTTTTPSSSTTETSSSSSSSSGSSTDDDSAARFTALEESFGGGSVDPVAQEPLPQPRRNGFYFLADWNSFLEVGEDPNKVVINFRPQAGDPSRFLPVNVP